MAAAADFNIDAVIDKLLAVRGARPGKQVRKLVSVPRVTLSQRRSSRCPPAPHRVPRPPRPAPPAPHVASGGQAGLPVGAALHPPAHTPLTLAFC